MNGTVKHINLDKGYGFLEASGIQDTFFHVSQLADSLQFDELLKGRRVVFDVEQTERGPQAINVSAAE
jgi:cold shock protein